MRTDDALRHLRRCSLSPQRNRVVKVRHSYRNSDNFSGRCGWAAIVARMMQVNAPTGKSVYPVIAAVTGPIFTFAPPAFFGTYSKNWPLPRQMDRALPPTRKIGVPPCRVTVLSLKVSSLRDWSPVFTAVPWRTLSFTTARRADAFDGSSLTSWTT